MKRNFYKLAICILILCFLNSCMLFKLHDDLEILDQHGTISGNIESDSPNHKPIVLLLVKIDEKNYNNSTIVNSKVMYKPGPFKFMVFPGIYALGAFEDKNEDLSFHPDEYVGWYGKPDLITIEKGKKYKGLNFTLRSPKQAHKQFPGLYKLSALKLSDDFAKDFTVGDVVSLNDSKFTAKNGYIGFWQPLKFLRKVKGGIFFLQKYDPEKIPILFVHGACGNPSEFKHLINSLDKDKFQPWVLFYPSGMRLGLVSRWVSEALTILKMQYKFDSLYIVAHSIGGLVSRDAINKQFESGGGQFLKLFISISTPWEGHAFAAEGVKQCPEVVPAWYDMVPGSPFLKTLFKTPFPSHLKYNLFFSYLGGWHLTISGNNDGTVSLKSELKLAAQHQAEKVLGFDVSHDEIVSNSIVIKNINRLLLQEYSNKD